MTRRAANLKGPKATVEGTPTFRVVFPILKGRNSAFIAGIASGLCPESEYWSLE